MIRTEITGAEIAEEMEKERRLFQLQMCEVRSKFQLLWHHNLKVPWEPFYLKGVKPNLLFNGGGGRQWSQGHTVQPYKDNYFSNSTKLGFLLVYSFLIRLLCEGCAETMLWKYFLFFKVYGWAIQKVFLISFFQHAFWSLLKFLLKL